MMHKYSRQGPLALSTLRSCCQYPRKHAPGQINHMSTRWQRSTSKSNYDASKGASQTDIKFTLLFVAGTAMTLSCLFEVITFPFLFCKATCLSQKSAVLARHLTDL